MPPIWLESHNMLHCLQKGQCPRIHSHVLVQINVANLYGFVEAPISAIMTAMAKQKRINITQLGTYLWWIPQAELTPQLKASLYDSWQSRMIEKFNAQSADDSYAHPASTVQA